MLENLVYIKYMDMIQQSDAVIAISTVKTHRILYIDFCINGVDDIESCWSTQKAREIADVFYRIIGLQSNDKVLKEEVKQDISPLKDHEWQSYLSITREKEHFILFVDSIELGFSKTFETGMDNETIKIAADAIVAAIDKVESL